MVTSIPPSISRTNSRIQQKRDLEADYVVESHIQAFAEALKADDFGVLDHDHTSSPGIATPAHASSSNLSIPHSPRIRKVSALSDFAPVNLKVKRRRKGHKYHDRRQEWLFVLLRWPLLFFIFLFIWAEFGLYVVIRQLVNMKEWLSAWRGRKGTFRKRLRSAQTYQEWKDAARVLDDYLGFNEWKQVDEDGYYDWKLVRKVRRSLKSLREANDVRGVLGVLETCIRENFAGVESSRLYSETFLGTKDLIESYFTEQERALEYIRESSELSDEEKRRFWKSANTNLGTTALCLSGGASFGYYHFGVVKAFLDEGLLPRVVTGTSAGGLIAALVGTRTDDELKCLIVPELANRITACEEPFSVWFNRFWTTGARFDSVAWARKCTFFTRGSMTFREAYLRTGRILNISVIPADQHSPTKLLNYMTAPDTVIWSALLASAAVPGILNPVVIMHKLKDGRIIPWNWGSKFKDGSLRVDIPVQALNLYFNVTHPVVSQVNPHVHLFFFAPLGSAGKPVAHRKGKGKGWRGNFLLSAAEQWLKLELTKNFKVIRDLELLPQLLGQDWSSVFLQRFSGAVTIWPRTRVLDWLHILSDPDPPELERMIRVGLSVTWPKLHMIENRFRIEKQIFLGRQAVRKSLQSRHQSQEVPTRIPLDSRPTARNPGLPHANGDDITSSQKPLGSLAAQEVPLSMDTDAESAFANGSQWFFKRGHHRISPDDSGTSTPRDNLKTNGNEDPLRSPLIRRKWASDLLKGEDSSLDYFRPATPDPPPSDRATPNAASPPPDGFFKRLRTRSFPALPSAFSSLHLSRNSTGKQVNREAATEPGWSSDSSSDEDLSMESRRLLDDVDHTYPQDFRTGGRRRYDVDDDDKEDEGYYMY